MNLQRWLDLMGALNTAPNLEVYAALVAAYAEPQRYYHKSLHIQECLEQFDRVRILSIWPADIELALWFHDAVYQPESGQNESNSAKWARQFLEGIGAKQRQMDHVSDLIMATTHQSNAPNGDMQLIMDVDLAILGRPPKRYTQFEWDIRQEYAWVPKPVYCQKRMAFLDALLERPSIYNTQYFRLNFEQQARINIKTAIAQLSI